MEGLHLCISPKIHPLNFPPTSSTKSSKDLDSTTNQLLPPLEASFMIHAHTETHTHNFFIDDWFVFPNHHNKPGEGLN